MMSKKYIFKKINNQIIGKVDDYIERNRQKNILFNDFILKISPLGEMFIVGGVIRDISINKTPNDIDLIIDTPKNNLKPLLDIYEHSLNRFGGYRFKLNKMTIDLWPMQDHWIFKKNPLKHSMIF